MNLSKNFVPFAALLVCFAAACHCHAQVTGNSRSYTPNSTGEEFLIEIDQLPTFNEGPNSPLNDNLTVDLGEVLGTDSYCFTDIAWDVNIETIGASWDNEATFLFTAEPLSATNAWFLQVGTLFGPTPPGGMNYVGGFINLDALGLPVLCPTDGNIMIQLFETFNDNPGEPDALLLENSDLIFGINGDGTDIESLVTVRFVPEPVFAAWLLPTVLFGARRWRRC